MVICLERGADLHMAQLMPLPLTVSCFSKIQIGFTFLVPADPGIPGQRAIKRMCVCATLKMSMMMMMIISLHIGSWLCYFAPGGVCCIAVSLTVFMSVCSHT